MDTHDTQLLNRWTTWLTAGSRSPGTIQLRLYYATRLREETDRPLCDIDGSELATWLASHGWGPNTSKSARSSLTSLFGWLHTHGLRSDNPAADLLGVQAPKGAPRPTPTHVVERALLEASDRDRLMIRFASLAGMRRAEIARVHTDDFLDDGIRIVGKGRVARIVPLHPLLAEEVGVEVERRREGRTGTGYRYVRPAPTGYVFPGRWDGHVSPDVVGRALSRVLGPGWAGHSLRHRFASRAYANAPVRDLLVVRDLLGHASVSTTEIYTAVPTSSMVDAVLAAA